MTVSNIPFVSQLWPQKLLLTLISLGHLEERCFGRGAGEVSFPPPSKDIIERVIDTFVTIGPRRSQRRRAVPSRTNTLSLRASCTCSTFPADARRCFLQPTRAATLLPLSNVHGSQILIIICNSVEYPDGHIDTLESNEHVHVEQDGEVKTQEE